MNELMELQTGQVAFISSLMAGFSLSIAVQIIRFRHTNKLTSLSFLLFTLSALLFLVALYIDVALSLRTAGYNELNAAALEQLRNIRNIGTAAATSGFYLFILSVALVGWLQSKVSGIITSIVALTVAITLLIVRSSIINLPL